MSGISHDFHPAAARGTYGAAHEDRAGRSVNEHWVEHVPLSCDGCGRGFQATGMLRTGWTVRPVEAGFAGSYCASCAAALQRVSIVVQCVACRRELDEDRAELEGWLYWPNRLAGLDPCCPECAQHELRCGTRS